jgi:hypothetical protein
MIKRSPYQPPPAPFAPGDKVKYEGRRYEVIAGTHTHSQLDTLPYAVPNWLLKPIRKPKDRDECSQKHLAISVKSSCSA